MIRETMTELQERRALLWEDCLEEVSGGAAAGVVDFQEGGLNAAESRSTGIIAILIGL